MRDNASTHSAVQVHDATRVSTARFASGAFAVSCFCRRAALRSIRLCFAFLKHWVRKWAPDEGYTQAALEEAIHDAASRITAPMVRNWIRGCGYGGARAAERPARARAARTARWVDAQGTLRPEGSAEDLVDVTAHRVPPDPPPPVEALARRWVGLGRMPAGLVETQPKSYAEALVDQQDTFEPERIVDERWRGRAVEYRIRWRGYDASGDTWEPVEHLLAGRRQLIRDWNKRRPA